jgi:hypothetical protein
VDEFPFSITLDDGKLIQFTELRFRREPFIPQACHRSYQIFNGEILRNNGDLRLKDLNLEEITAYSLNIETLATTCAIKKGVPRITLVDDKGNRVLDTLVKPELLGEGEKHIVKEGLKCKIFELAQDQGAKLELVLEVIKFLIKGKPLISYHLPLKL